MIVPIQEHVYFYILKVFYFFFKCFIIFLKEIFNLLVEFIPRFLCVFSGIVYVAQSLLLAFICFVPCHLTKFSSMFLQSVFLSLLFFLFFFFGKNQICIVRYMQRKREEVVAMARADLIQRQDLGASSKSSTQVQCPKALGCP